MPAIKPEWKPVEGPPLGRGATVQAFTSSVGARPFKLKSRRPGVEGSLKVNGREIAHVGDAKDRRQASRELKKIAERYHEGQPINSEGKRSFP